MTMAFHSSPRARARPSASSTSGCVATPMFASPAPPPPPPGTPSSVLPKPVFLAEPQSFSTKKNRTRTPRNLPPPRPQIKTCPPVSRVFARRPDYFGAQSVTFLESHDGSLTGSPFPRSSVYDSSRKESYFEQAFTVLKTIGAGYFGTVVKVKSKEDGRLYAVKIAKERYRGPTDRKLKLEEVRKHQFLLPHPNCVHFYQSWEENGRLYQQFELCQMSLDELSERKHELPEELIWAYLVDLLLAVQHLHNHNLVHMDIKPENIFIGRDGICKLGDFGLVIDLAKDNPDSLGGLASLGGDAKYMSNEILTGKFTRAADIFSLGLTLLELACDLDLPTGGPLWHQLRQTGPDPTLTAHLSPELRRVIQLMMGRDEERRPTVQQLLDLPDVKKARKRRQRQLAKDQVIRTFKSSFLTPLLTYLTLIFGFLLATPLGRVWERVRSSLAKRPPDKQDMITPEKPLPMQEGSADKNGLHFGPSFSYSSDEEDCSAADRHSLSSSSVLASPLHPDDSDATPSSPSRSSRSSRIGPPDPFEAVDHSPIRSPHYPRGPRRLQPGQQTQSTPSGMNRHQSKLLSASRRRIIGMSPPKRLDFDSVPDSANLEGSIQDALPPLKDQANANDLSDLADKSSLCELKPVSLASTFDVFSDDSD